MLSNPRLTRGSAVLTSLLLGGLAVVSAAGPDTRPPRSARWAQPAAIPFEALSCVVWRDSLYVTGRCTEPDCRAALAILPLKADTLSPATVVPAPAGVLIRQANAMAVYDGLLCIAGFFPTGERPFSRGPDILAFDGHWRDFPQPPCREGMVRALAVFDGKLLALGAFFAGPGDSCENALIWDGKTWAPTGLHLGREWEPVVVSHEGRLYAAFNHEQSGLDEQFLFRHTFENVLLAWEGARWEERTRGVGRIGNLVSLGGALYAAVGPRSLNEEASPVVAYSGGAWRPIDGDGAGQIFRSGSVTGLVDFDGRLIAAGFATGPGGDLEQCVAFWDGSSWRVLDESGGTGYLSEPSPLCSVDQRLWCERTVRIKSAEFRHELVVLSGPLPADAPPLPSLAPRAEHNPLLMETVPPFQNGDFSQWTDGRLQGWYCVGGLMGPYVDRQRGFAGGCIARGDSGGVKLTRRGWGLAQQFPIHPGRGYRATVRARAAGDRDPQAPAIFSLWLGSKHESLRIGSGDLRTYELTDIAPADTRVGLVHLEDRRENGGVEIQEVTIEEIEVCYPDCFAAIDADLRAHYPFSGLASVDWDKAVAFYGPLAANAVNDEAFCNIVIAALGRLNDPTMRVAQPSPDSPDVEAVALTHVRPGPWSPASRKASDRPPHRLIVPCGFRIEYDSQGR